MNIEINKNALLELCDLQFDSRTSFSWKMETGRCVGLVGLSGSGRSRLLKTIAGIESRKTYKGKILFEGKEIKTLAQQRQECGIFYLPRDPAFVDRIQVWENLFLSENLSSEGFFSKNSIYRDAEKLLSRLPVEIEPSLYGFQLDERQKLWLCLARMFIRKRKLILIDESTHQLDASDLKIFYAMLENQIRDGASVLFAIPNLVRDVGLCDQFVILTQQGMKVWEPDDQEESFTRQLRLEKLRNVDDHLFPPKRSVESLSTEIQFEIKNLTYESDDKIVLDHINLQIRKGEIFGLTGKSQSGRVKLGLALFGEYLSAYRFGKIILNGKEIEIRDAFHAAKSGLAYMSGFRSHFGVFANQSVGYNLDIIYSRIYHRWSLLPKRALRNIFKHYAKILRLGAIDYATPWRRIKDDHDCIQKILLARWLALHPKLLILDDPARGMSASGRRELYALIRELADEGLSIIFTSSNLQEISLLCDRVAIFEGPGIKEVLTSQNIDLKNILGVVA
ncbi:MAG: hypothetical protein COV44_01915 [Deltaproteobacteria bacterium CG11_big_fil_rev_8_21_14_0_20_45_16]|nr:MAG: hypothetical protein COV44_01915 [Deltaproteobacteria bacterium CG11_big_fil_rev_8_21_14_0_20_45_16]